MTEILGHLPFDWKPAVIYGFYLLISLVIFVVFYYSFKTNWSSLHAAVKGTGVVILFALPFYGFSIIDTLQWNYRNKDLGGARILSTLPAPEGVVISDGGCGALCQEMLLEDQVRFVELARSGLVTKFGVNPPARFEKIAGRDQCDEARANATPADDLNLNSTGLVALDPRFQGALALGHCIAFVIIDELTAPVVIHTWPKEGPHAPMYLGDSDTVHHDIYRRGANLEVAEMLARSESAWVDVVDFPPRIRFSDPPENDLSFSIRLSYDAPPLTEFISRTLSLDIDGRLDFTAAAAPMLLANLRDGDEARRIGAAAALRDLAARRGGAGATEVSGETADGGAGQDGDTLDTAWIPPLVSALEDDNPSVRKSAAEAIGAYGPLAEPAIPALVDALGDTDEDVVSQARSALSNIGPGAVWPLIAALDSADGDIRIGAARVLGAIGPAAAAAGPALLALLDGETGALQSTAAWALGKIQWNEAVPHLLTAIEHPDGELHDSAKSALAHLGSVAVPGLIDKLGHDDDQVRLRVVDALGAIGPAARDALPALRAAMGGKPQVNYVWAIEKIEGKRNEP